MALVIHGKTECPLCNEVINKGDALVATTHFIADQTDPLWKYSDAAIHEGCFLAWEQRQRFVDTYNAVMGSITWGNGTYHHMTNDGRILARRRDPEQA